MNLHKTLPGQTHVCFIKLLILAFLLVNIVEVNGQISIQIEFDSAPTSVDIQKAPLKYNKDFAYSHTLDDALISAYTVAYKLFNGGFIEGNSTTYPGLYYTDGCGNDIPFRSGIAMWTWKGSNDEDMHTDPNGYGMMTWAQIDELYEAGWDVYNHGFTHGNGPGTDYEYQINENFNYVKDITSNHIEMKHFVIPAGDTNYIQPVFATGQYRAIYNEGGHNFIGGSSGMDVDGSLDLHELRFLRKNSKSTLIENVNRIDAIAANSNINNHLWFGDFNHGVDNFGDEPFGFLFENFAGFMQHIEQVYGKSGSDRVWMAPSQEVYEYLLVREEANYCVNQFGNTVTINLNTEDIPDDLRRYALSFNVGSDVNFSNITVSGASNYSFKGTGSNKLINIEWETSSFNPAAPVWDAPETLSVSANTSTTIDINVVDPDGDLVSITSQGPLPSFAGLNNPSSGFGQLTLNPSTSQKGFYPLKIKITDTDGNFNVYDVELAVTLPGNIAPQVNGPAVMNIYPGNTENFNFVASDPDNADLVYSASNLPCFVSPAVNPDGTVTLNVAPGPDITGTFYALLIAKDPDGGRGDLPVTFNIGTSFPGTSTKILIDPSMFADEIEGNFPSSFLGDEQAIAGEPLLEISGQPSSSAWFPGSSASFPAYSIADLGATYQLNYIFLHDFNSSGNFRVYSGSAGDWTLLLTDPCDNYNSWISYEVNIETRFLRFEMESTGARVNEIVLYGFNVGNDLTAPAPVNDLQVDAFDCEKLRLSWTASGNDGNIGMVAEYDIRYNTVPLTEGNFNSSSQHIYNTISGPAGTTEFTEISGLDVSSDYYFALKARDLSGNISELSNLAGPAKALVKNLSAFSNPAGSGVQLNWDALPGADFYQVKGRKSGQSAFGKFVTPNTVKNVSGLIPGTDYEWQIRARCTSNDITPFNDLETFTTNFTALKISNDIAEEDITVFPNPASSLFNLQFKANKGEADIEITDALGKVVYFSRTGLLEGGNIVSVDSGIYSPGLYNIRIVQGQKLRVSRVLIK